MTFNKTKQNKTKKNAKIIINAIEKKKNGKKMGAGVLPACLMNNRLYFLFGKENKFADTPGWSDFGGGTMGKESNLETAIREGTEELTGCLGNLRQVLLSHGYLAIPVPKFNYVMHIFPYPYDTQLVDYFNNTRQFLDTKLSNTFIKKSKIFEKSEIKWFSVEEMVKHKNSFRSYFREIVDLLEQEAPKIKSFLQTKKKNTKTKTKKENGH
jgi:8-oxo-dGTP pyrophosphatase MutT (NUDIX family)